MYYASKFIDTLPKEETPEQTEGYEGFYHLLRMEGNVEDTLLHYIVRDHDRHKFEARKQHLISLVESLNTKFESPIFEIELKDQYYNMKEKVVPVMHIVDIAEDAMKALNIKKVSYI